IAVVWLLIYNPAFGLLNQLLKAVGLGGLTHVWLGDSSTALPAVLAISVWRWTGFNLIIYLAGIQTITKDLYEAAAIDGANRVQAFFRVTLPLLAPYTFV